jgi:hypothetical protein
VSLPFSRCFRLTLLTAFLCPHPGCAKKFSRVDNLNQHLRVHVNGRASGASSPKVRKARKSVKKEDAEEEPEAEDSVRRHLVIKRPPLMRL